MTFSRMKRDYYALDSLRNLCTQILNTEKCIKDWHREIQESNITVAQLVTLNVEDEQAINTILGSNQEAGNNATHNGISFSSRNTSGKVLNHYQAGEIRDLRTKISERMVQIDKHNNHQKTISESLHTLNCELRNYNSTYQMTLEELSRSQKSYLSKMESIQNEIFQLYQGFLSVHERAITLDSIIERRTTSFTAYLAEVETLKESFSHGASPYSQLKSAISVLMESVKSSVTLLTSTELKDISDARRHLLKQATFLSNYWETTRTVLQPTSN